MVRTDQGLALGASRSYPQGRAPNQKLQNRACGRDHLCLVFGWTRLGRLRLNQWDEDGHGNRPWRSDHRTHYGNHHQGRDADDHHDPDCALIVAYLGPA
jgi:hypothetical protein